MSGHSKWATIKHKKGAADKARGKLFAKLARQIEVAARAGGGDVDSNATLRTMVLKAKSAQMNKDAIDRAIKRGIGETGGANYEAITYEAYAPGGVAMLIEILTDNRNRAASDVRSIFTKHGGAMAEPGAVAWQFARRAVVYVGGAAPEESVVEAAIEAGAEDVGRDGDSWKIVGEPGSVEALRSGLEGLGHEVLSAEATMVSANSVPVTDPDDVRRILAIMDALEDNDDVQDVYSNFDIDEALMLEA
jgi:YebC/PmpR family DNA-binding regulatory protein